MLWLPVETELPNVRYSRDLPFPPRQRKSSVVHSLPRMTQTLIHRGPDDEGYYADTSVAFGHRRLSIIDLSTGHQPIANEDGTIWVVFNGEIYNYVELSHDLVAKGHVFRTRSDTETIVHAYEEWGLSCLDHLRGMFAFALWDRARQRLVLARDRLGKKPLYCARIGQTLVFGSELKALLPFPGLDRTLDLEAVSDYFSLGYIPREKTIFRQVRKLLPGHYLVAERESVHVRSYWDIHFAAHLTPDESAVETLAALLRESVTIRRRSDVPLGAFLSGGLDSSTAVGLMTNATESPVITAPIGFPVRKFNELPYTLLAARHFHTDHSEQVVTPSAVDVVETLISHFDEPFGDSSAIPTYYVSQLARSRVTVALSGDGGDESFAGYRRHYFDARENMLRALIPARLRRGVFGFVGSLYPKADYLPRAFRGKAFLSNVARSPPGKHTCTRLAPSERPTRCIC